MGGKSGDPGGKKSYPQKGRLCGTHYGGKIIKILHSSWCRMHPYGGKIDHQMGGKPPPAGPIFPPYGGKIGLPGGQFLCCTHNECKISPYYHHGKPWLQNDLVVFPPLWGEKTTYVQTN